MESKEYTRCLIIGSGPAGYTAAIYAARADMSPILYCGLQTGGQLTQTTEVENFPGYPTGVDGNQMMVDLREQAERYGTEVRDGEIVKADLSKAPYLLTTEKGQQIEAETVIIATGASAKYLGLDDEEKYKGKGVSACATCDGFFYRKKVVAVVGGGDTACEETINGEVVLFFIRLSQAFYQMNSLNAVFTIQAHCVVFVEYFNLFIFFYTLLHYLRGT